MKHTARITQRSVKVLGRIAPQAHMSKQLQLAAMQCARLGHVRSNHLSSETPPRFLCSRCLKVLDTDDKVV